MIAFVMNHIRSCVSQKRKRIDLSGGVSESEKKFIAVVFVLCSLASAVEPVIGEVVSRTFERSVAVRVAQDQNGAQARDRPLT